MHFICQLIKRQEVELWVRKLILHCVSAHKLFRAREKSGWNVKGRSWKCTQRIRATVPKCYCHNTVADSISLKKKVLRLAQCFPFDILDFFYGKGAIIPTEWQWDKTRWKQNNRYNMFLQHLTGQVWDCFNFWWRKAKSETSGPYIVSVVSNNRTYFY